MTVRKDKMPESLAMKRALGALVLAVLALSACAPLESMQRELFPPEDAAAGDTQAVSSASRPSTVPPLPRRKPEAISQPAAIADQPKAVSDQPEAVSELTPAEADPDRLVGLDFDAAKALLGDPVATHEEPPAEVWAYEGGICSFNLFFYPSVDDKVFRVLAYEVTKEIPPAEEMVAGEMTAEAAEPGAVEVSGALEVSGAVKVPNKNNPMVRRCFAELLHNQKMPDAG